MKNIVATNIDSLFDQSDEWLETFKNLKSPSPNDPDSIQFEKELEPWLTACADVGRFLPTGSPDRRSVKALLEEWHSRLRRADLGPKSLVRLTDFDPAAGLVLDKDCPYPGLDAYRAGRRASFFGRDALVVAYAKRLVENRIFLIVGASGSGKSSLALAGLQPHLQEQHPDWLCAADFTPGATPLLALAEAVGTAAGKADEAPDLTAKLRRNPSDAPRELNALCAGRPLMLLVDQFEELFTLCRDPAEQQAFAEVLLGLSAPTADAWRCYTLLTLRTDHLSRFESSDGLKPLHHRLVDERNFEHLPALGFADIKRAITEPAKTVGLRFIPADIPDGLASETAGLANGLPLLQFALRRLWDTRPYNEQRQPLDLINEDMLKALPDVRGALGKVADEIYEGLTLGQRAICKRLILELVVLDENFEEPLRRRRNRAELMGVLASRFPEAGEDINTVEKQFITAGLLRSFGSGNEQQIEVTHEALLRHWSEINEEVSGEEAKQRLHAVKQITREAMEWKASGQSSDRLKQQGKPLAAALDYLADGWLAEAEAKAYLEACKQREEAALEQARQLDLERAEAQEARDAELRAQNEKERVKADVRRNYFWISLTLFILTLGSLAYFNSQKDLRTSSLETAASLTERLPAPEALDLTYTLAKKGGEDFRLGLAHALERMEDSWLIGQRNSPLFPTVDGTALLQFDRSEKKSRLLIYLIDNQGKPMPGAIEVPVDDSKFDRLNQVQIGPEIEAHPGKHWAVLAYGVASDKPGFLIETYLLDKASKTAKSLAITNLQQTQWDVFNELSTIRFHATGLRAIVSGIDYPKFKSHLFELGFDGAAKVTITELEDPAAENARCPDTDKDCIGRNIVSAVTYGYHDMETITGRLDGSLFCGKTLALEPSRGDSSPVRTTFGHFGTQWFATANAAGVVRAVSCTNIGKDKHKRFPLLQGNPTSLKWTLVERKGKGVAVPLLTYLDSEQQLRCYLNEFRGEEHEHWQWYPCNSAHPLSAAVVMPNGKQLAVEQSGTSAVRHYPSEGWFNANDKRTEARMAPGITLRWTQQPSADQTDRPLKSEDDIRWSPPKESGVNGDDWRVTAVALSPQGKKLVWSEQRSPKEKQGSNEQLGKIRTMTPKTKSADDWHKFQSGNALAVAIDDQGRVAHYQEGKDVQPELYLDDVSLSKLKFDEGKPKCLAFSPSGGYLVLGTDGGKLVRFVTGEKPDQDNQLVTTATKTGDKPVPVTACAVADDGWVVAGYSDGNVWVFPHEGDASLLLTERTVYRFPVQIKQVSFGSQKQVSALGEWQINGCTSQGLPGQTLRVWDLSQPDLKRNAPVSNACFPNQVIAALGPWEKLGDGAQVQDCNLPKAATAGKAAAPGICLIGPDRNFWHACPGCTRDGDTVETIHQRLLEKAKFKGARELSATELKQKYGLKLE